VFRFKITASTIGPSDPEQAAQNLLTAEAIEHEFTARASTRSKFVPYVVEVDKLGYAIGAPNALTESTFTDHHRPDGAVRVSPLLSATLAR
jgi:hypothetical protein